MDASDPNTWRWIWLVAMVVFGIGEMATAGSFFLAPFALGAAVAAIAAFFGVGVGVDWAIFLGVSIISFLALRPLAHRLNQTQDTLGIGANRQIGQRAQILEAIKGPQEAGMALIGAEKWRAESFDGRPIDVGAAVTVVEVRGTRVVVEPSPEPLRDEPSRESPPTAT